MRREFHEDYTVAENIRIMIQIIYVIVVISLLCAERMKTIHSKV